MKTLLKWQQPERLAEGSIVFCNHAYRNVRITSCKAMGQDGYWIEASHL